MYEFNLIGGTEAMTTPTQTEMPERVHTVFKELFGGLESMKQQQWKITNYAVLLLAASFALKGKANSCALVAIVWATAFIGSSLLLRIQWNLGRYRQRIDGVHKAYFTDQELIDIGLTDAERRDLGKKTQFKQCIRGWEYALALMAVLVGGALLVSIAH